MTRVDLVVVGSGVAGLTAALRAVELGLRVLVVTKGALDDGNTRWAQGGVAVVLNDAGVADQDTVEDHVADTIAAGGGLCDPVAVHAILAAGPAAVARLRERGARFDTGPDGRLIRTLEGGHHALRVVHAGGDATGAEVERALGAAARSGGIAVLEHRYVTDVLRDIGGRVVGVATMGPDGAPGTVTARAVLLATGGLGQLYSATTNPAGATADGVAIALRAGATVADLEFVQFHPTVLYAPGASGHRPLVTEAVRGEGAVLRDVADTAFMAGVHPLADLAPRDVVAAAATRRMAATGTDHVLLDATAVAGFADRFPTVFASCLAAGIDPRVTPIPVAPAAHYQCGGVATDVHGRTAIPGLYAAGEVARTGLHGANRLASNSLLEGLVVGAAVAEAVAAEIASGLAEPVGPTLPVAGVAVPIASRAALQRAMSAHAAVGRDAAGLATVRALLDDAGNRVPSTPDDHADAALTLTARALVAAALRRTHSRGCHVRSDTPLRADGTPQPDVHPTHIVRMSTSHARVSTADARVLADSVSEEHP